MGIIKSQTLKSSIYTYAGVLLGFITVALLFPQFLSPEQIGVINLLIAFAMIFGQMGTLGFSNAIVKYFPYFRNKEQGHQGFVIILLTIGLLGFLLFLVLFLSIRPYIISSNVDSSPLFVEYINYIIPLTFFLLLFPLLETYNNVLYNTTTAIFLKEFLQRILILLTVILFIFNIIDYDYFLFLYTSTFFIITAALLFYLNRKGEFQLRIPKLGQKKHIIRGMISISTFGFLTGFSNLAIMKIDVIMLNQFSSSVEAGIYATTFYFGTLIILPSRAINRIASTIIADAYKERNFNVLREIYYKSCINQFILGSYLLLGIWINIDNVFKIIPPEYEAGKYVILFIGLSNLIKMTGGIDTALIGYSKYYKFNALFIFLLLLLSVATNWLLIPAYGLTGAAIASMISVSAFVIIKFIFIKRNFDFQPYNIRYFYVLFASLATYLTVKILPSFSFAFLDVGLKAILVTIIFIPLVYLTKASLEFNQIFDNGINRYFKR